MTGRVSVVVPTRNRARHLPASMESLLRCLDRRDELVLVDDSSEDETPAVCRHLQEVDSRVRYVRMSMASGAPAARNHGARVATGDLLVFSDDDTTSHPERIAALREALGARPDAGVAYCHVECRHAGGQREVFAAGALSATTSAVMLRRSVFEAAGGFDEALPRLQDFDLWTRILLRTEPAEVPRVLVTMTRDSSGISASIDRLNRAGRHLLTKYSTADMPAMRLAGLHRLLAGKLMTGEGERGLALRHAWRALRVDVSMRSFGVLALVLAGRTAYRNVAAFTSSPHRPDRPR